MIIVAVVISNGAYGHLFLGREGADLNWGPTLFRLLLIIHGALLVTFGLRLRKSISVVEEIQTVKVDRAKRVSPVVIGTLLALSIIALVLRLWNLNSDLWIDEVLTLLDFVRRPIGEILTSFPSQNQHMLFSVLARASVNVFGESPWALRLPSVLFGVGSIWAFFFLCRSLLSTREALLGSALLTVSYHHIWFSQNARGYMGLLLFTLMATWCWFEALKANEWRWWMGYTASVVFGMWVHPTMAFVVAAHGLVHLTLLAVPRLSGENNSLERRAGLRPFAAWMLSVTVTLQLYALALPEFLAVGLHEESKNSEWTNPFWVVTESLRSLSIGFAGIAVVLAGGAFVAFGWVCLFRTNRRAAVLMVLPAALAGGTMLALGHNLWPRFFFFSMGFGLMIVIHGAVRLPEVVGNWFRSIKQRSLITRFAGVGICLLIIAVSLTTVSKNYALPKQNFSGAKTYVESHMSPGDRIVAVSLAGVVYGRYLTPYWPVAKTDQELEPIQQADQNVWLVYTIPIEIKAFRPELWRKIETDYEIVQVFPGTLNGGEVFVCRKRTN
jgi:hypothetical protein